jgi:hypothetical protein
MYLNDILKLNQSIKRLDLRSKKKFNIKNNIKILNIK